MNSEQWKISKMFLNLFQFIIKTYFCFVNAIGFTLKFSEDKLIMYLGSNIILSFQNIFNGTIKCVIF